MESGRLVAGLVGLLVAGMLAAGAMMTLARTGGSGPDADASAPAAPAPVVTTGVLRHGDCGDRRRGNVEPVACSDPRADVEVGARRAIGDPRDSCPLYASGTVLATSGGVGSLYICWTPIGGGPSRAAGTPEVVEVTTTEPGFATGTCGDVHDQHVHAPLSCDDDRADGIVVAWVADAVRCPSGTLLAVPSAVEDRAICWAQR